MIQVNDSPEMIKRKLKFGGVTFVFSSLFWWLGVGVYSVLLGIFFGMLFVYWELKKQDAAAKIVGEKTE